VRGQLCRPVERLQATNIQFCWDAEKMYNGLGVPPTEGGTVPLARWLCERHEFWGGR